MNERTFYVPFNAFLGYIGTATFEGILVLSDIHVYWRDVNPHVHWPVV